MDDTKPNALTKKQRQQQELILGVINHPLMKHSAFTRHTGYYGKIGEMYNLRRAQTDPSRTRKERPNVPMLNFSLKQISKISRHLQELATVLDEQLSQAKRQPYERRQETLKNLLRSRKELTVKQTVTGLESKAATRWINFVKNVRKPLPLSDRYIVAYVSYKLQDLLVLINSALKAHE